MKTLNHYAKNIFLHKKNNNIKVSQLQYDIQNYFDVTYVQSVSKTNMYMRTGFKLRSCRNITESAIRNYFIAGSI
jgi:hypothetical protein